MGYIYHVYGIYYDEYAYLLINNYDNGSINFEEATLELDRLQCVDDNDMYTTSLSREKINYTLAAENNEKNLNNIYETNAGNGYGYH